METIMRRLLLTAATIAGIGLPTAAGAQVVIAADPAPGVVVTAPPPRYYQDCWWDWGRRVCRLKPWW